MAFCLQYHGGGLDRGGRSFSINDPHRVSVSGCPMKIGLGRSMVGVSDGN